MGSCDDMTMVAEPIYGQAVELRTCSVFSEKPVSEQQPCPAIVYVSLDSSYKVDSIAELDKRLVLTRNDVRTNGAESNMLCRDGSIDECETSAGLVLQKRLDDNGVREACLDENQSVRSLDGRGLSQCVDGLVNLFEGCKMTFEIMATGRVLGDCVEQDEPKSDESVSGASEEVLVEILEEKSGFLAEIENGPSDSTPEFPPDSTSVQSNCVQPSELKDAEGVSGAFCEVTNEKTDTSDEIQVDMFDSISPSVGVQLPPTLLDTGELVLYSDTHIGNVNKLHAGLYAEKVAKVSNVKNSTDTCIQVLSSQSCEKPVELLQIDDYLTVPDQQDQQRDEKSIRGPSGTSVAKVVENQGDIATNSEANIVINVLPVEENSCTLKEGHFVMSPNSIVEKLPSLLGHPLDVEDDGSSETLNVPILSLKDVASVGSSSAVDCFGQVDDEGKDKVRVDCVLETMCPDTMHSCAQMNGRRTKSTRKTLTKGASRRRKSSNKVPRSCRNIQFVFDAAKRKRSCISKPARSSIWGSLSSITQFFRESTALGVNQIQNEELIKVKRGRRSANRNKTKANQRSRSSRRGRGGKFCTSTGCVRLKVKLGKKVDQSFLNIMVPDAVDTSLSANAMRSIYGSESYWSSSLEIPKLTNGVDKMLEERVSRPFQSSRGDIEIPQTPTVPPARNDSISSVIMLKTSIKHDVGVSSHMVEPLDRESNSRCLDPGASGSSCSSVSKDLSIEPMCSSRETELGGEAAKVEDIVEAEASHANDVCHRLFEAGNSKHLLASKSTSHKLSKDSQCGKARKVRCNASDSAARRGNGQRQKEIQQKTVNKNRKKDVDHVASTGESYPERGNYMVNDIGKTSSSNNIAFIEGYNVDVVNGVLSEQHSPPQTAWVLCDDCQKWRRIPAPLVDMIGQANCTWTCKDNMDKAFADCSIPQEKSNAEINAELEISDGSGEENTSVIRPTYQGLGNHQQLKVSQGPVFTRIKSNHYLHRNRKTQTIDEIMVCHCKSLPYGNLGCGDECLNRMLNIECVRGTCPCGDICSNQQFQKRKYAKLGRFRCGKKGYGLQSLEDISQGQFLIEYVGEVLDMPAYEARQKEYAINGHRHFYFMTLNSNEVIDACAKGNLGRFINHSCDPNCRTEKWMVNGEICIGLFALRDIKKGEEVTFDYNYVRVFGAAAKKCYCSSPQCRGFIGGDPLNSEVIIQSDSDEEYMEPVKLLRNGKTRDRVFTRASSSDGTETVTVESSLSGRDKVDRLTPAIGRLEITREKEDPMNHSASTVTELQSSLEFEELKASLPSSIQLAEVSQETDVTCTPMSVVEHETSVVEETSNKNSCSIERLEVSCLDSMQSKSLSDGIDSDRKSKIDRVEHKRESSKPRTLVKISRKSGSVKKGNLVSDPSSLSKVKLSANKSQLPSVNQNKSMNSSLGGRFEAVEEKLNELLDADGGISKRKDSPKAYLKLLLLTAASGDRSNGEAIQSNRDLSMILDALLKTKSRVVLIDIINKNGLQMLHNIMKQYRRDFKKIPILRKLLKVLEYLAVREILTSEHINGGPPCQGMESFAESMLSLTEHEDKQVHKIVRNFRDRWIHRPVRKPSHKERDDGRMEFHRGPNCNRFSSSQGYHHDQDVRQTETMESVKQSNQTEPMDCIKQSNLANSAINVQEGNSVVLTGSLINGTRTRKRKSRWDQPAEPKPESRSPQFKEQEIESRLLPQLETSQSNAVGEGAMDTGDKLHHGKDERQNNPDIPEDVPPGFSSPLFSPLDSSKASSSAVTALPQLNSGHSNCVTSTSGHPQEKFISRMPVSYGIPLTIMQKFGITRAENPESWDISPGMPFHPFPPLPPIPKDKHKVPPPCPALINQAPEEKQCESSSLHSYSCESSPSTIVDNQQQMFIQANSPSSDLGKRYFRQQKWNSAKSGPPWLRSRNGWGYPGSNPGPCSPQV